MNEDEPQNKLTCCYCAEFDDLGGVGKVEVLDADRTDIIKITIGEHERVFATSYRDQCGVWYTIGGISTAQEDGTRSFIDALIGAIEKLKSRCEISEKATITHLTSED